jgi:hypothetical protein
MPGSMNLSCDLIIEELLLPRVFWWDHAPPGAIDVDLQLTNM